MVSRLASLALCASLLSSTALAGHAEPVGCPQMPALTGAVTSSATTCATSEAAGSGQKQPTTPTKPASTSAFQMQGLAGSITPVRTGRVLLIISGNFVNSSGTINTGAIVQLSHGTGTAPTNAATLIGTQDANPIEYVNPVAVTAGDVFIPFSTQAVVTGLALNTAVWIDLAAKAVTTVSTGGVQNVSISAIEF